MSFPTQLVFPRLSREVAGGWTSLIFPWALFLCELLPHSAYVSFSSWARAPGSRAFSSLPRAQASLPCSVTLELDPLNTFLLLALSLEGSGQTLQKQGAPLPGSERSPFWLLWKVWGFMSSSDKSSITCDCCSINEYLIRALRGLVG